LIKVDCALVLRVEEFMESSLIITALSQRGGLIKLVAKGAQRLKSPLRMSFQLFSLSEFIFYYKTDRELNILKEGKILEVFDHLPENYNKFSLVSTISSYIIKSVPQEAGEDIYTDTVNFFRFVNKANTLNQDLYNFFVIRNLMRQGEIPYFNACGRCGNEPIEFFLPSKKIAVCKNCIKEGEDTGIAIDRGTTSEIKFVLEKNWQEINALSIRDKTREVFGVLLREQ